MEGGMVSVNGSIASSTSASFNLHGQSFDEMRDLLMCATMELESARTAATAQGQLHEARVRHLQEILKTTRRERDEARKQYHQLQEQLLRSPSLNGSGLSDSLPNTGLAAVVESAADAHHHLEELEEHLELNETHHSSSHAPLVHHDQQLDHLEDPVQVLHHLDLPSPDAHSSLPPLPPLPPLHCPSEQCSLHSLDDLQQSSSPVALQHQQGQHSLQRHHRHRHQLLQHSSDEELEHESEQLLLQMQQQSEQQLQSGQQVLVHQQAMHESLVSMGAMSVLQHSTWQSLPGGGAGFPQPGICSPPLSSLGLQTACLHSGSAVASLLSPLKPYKTVGSGPVQLHLPEPPEADLQVMLKSLPEKGKLLQAVMQAGPLLQTLLVAGGPLPQWRHPPPALDTLDIPRVSMSSSTPCDSQPSVNNIGRMTTGTLEQHGGIHPSPPIPSQESSLSHLSVPLSVPTTPNSCFASQGILRVSSMGHLAPDMRLLNPPLKYAKIH